MANLETIPMKSAASAGVSARGRALSEAQGELAFAVPARKSLARDLVALTKPRITLMVLITGAAGMCVAPGSVSRASVWLSLLGMALVVSSANALNMWWERDTDGKMSRTRERPLPAGRLNPDVALAFGLLLAVVSTPMLFAVNFMTGLLALVALVTYAVVYTPLKKYSWLALLVGAVPGAMPPLMGWTTVTGRLDVGGILLFSVLFFWQVPHFSAIALFRRDDYAAAGLKVISVDRSERTAKNVVVGYTGVLVAVTLLLHAVRLAGAWYLAVAVVLGGAFLALGARGYKTVGERENSHWAKQVFAYSIVYLVALLTSLLLDRVGA